MAPPVRLPTACGGVVIVHRDGSLQCTAPTCPAAPTRAGILRSHLVFSSCQPVLGDDCPRCAELDRPTPPVVVPRTRPASRHCVHRRVRGRGGSHRSS